MVRLKGTMSMLQWRTFLSKFHNKLYGSMYLKRVSFGKHLFLWRIGRQKAGSFTERTRIFSS